MPCWGRSITLNIPDVSATINFDISPRYTLFSYEQRPNCPVMQEPGYWVPDVCKFLTKWEGIFRTTDENNEAAYRREKNFLDIPIITKVRDWKEGGQKALDDTR